MKWFVAICEESPRFREYADMVRVAVHTAQTRTTLQPFCLYDGKTNEFTNWLTSRGVTIVHRSSRFSAQLAEVLHHLQKPDLVGPAKGTFLRVEIPELQGLYGEDERVLYTDCDVLFERDPVPYLDTVECGLFSAAPEADPTYYHHINSGVMLMNPRGLRSGFDEFVRYIERNLTAFCRNAMDQDAYNTYYLGQWTRLRPEMNWKPYWGKGHEAMVVHFHGPKPTQMESFRRGEPFAIAPNLLNDGYYLYANLWKSYLNELR